MNNKVGLLSVLLVVQLVLVVAALVVPLGGDDAPPALLAFSSEDVDKLTISDGTDEIEITRTDSGWQVAGVPADADKISDTLVKLAGIDAPWPVATSGASAERFEVSEDNYQRYLHLEAGGNSVARLYLGTSPGFQRVHARRADGDEVFSVALSNYELGVDVDNWLDKAVLEMAAVPTRIEASLEGKVEILESTDEGWLYNGNAADQDAATTYANRFTTLRVLGLAKNTEASEPEKEVGRIALGNTDEQLTLVISRAGEDDYTVVADHEPAGGDAVRYRLATYVAEQLLMADADFSVQDTASEEEE